MQISVTFKNLDPSDALKSYVQKKLDRFDRLLDNPAEANVVFSVEKIRHIAEISLTGDRINIHAKSETNSMYSAIDMVIDKLKKQLNRNKEKIWGQRAGSKDSIKDTIDTEPMPVDEDSLKVVVENIDYKPMDVDEAILQMDFINDNFFVFTNGRTEQVNVLYKKKDGNLGLIQPNPQSV